MNSKPISLVGLSESDIATVGWLTFALFLVAMLFLILQLVSNQKSKHWVCSSLVLMSVCLGTVPEIRTLFEIKEVRAASSTVDLLRGQDRIEVTKNADGHFWLQAEINGVEADFLIDTGATFVALSSEFAETAKLQERDSDEAVSVLTASGEIVGRLTTIEEIKVGSMAIEGVQAIVSPKLRSENLIGMNFLSRFAIWRVEGEKLILESA